MTLNNTKMLSTKIRFNLFCSTFSERSSRKTVGKREDYLEHSSLLAGLNMRQISNEDESYKQELARLDTMLLAERIIDPYPNDLPTNNSVEIEHPEYEEKLNRIRHFYHTELAQFDKNSNDFCTHVITLIHEQSRVRPITPEEISHMISIVRKKLCLIQIQLKQNTCEAVMNLRTRFLDARYERSPVALLSLVRTVACLDANDETSIRPLRRS